MKSHRFVWHPYRPTTSLFITVIVAVNDVASADDPAASIYAHAPSNEVAEIVALQHVARQQHAERQRETHQSSQNRLLLGERHVADDARDARRRRAVREEVDVFATRRRVHAIAESAHIAHRKSAAIHAKRIPDDVASLVAKVAQHKLDVERHRFVVVADLEFVVIVVVAFSFFSLVCCHDVVSITTAAAATAAATTAFAFAVHVFVVENKKQTEKKKIVIRSKQCSSLLLFLFSSFSFLTFSLSFLIAFSMRQRAETHSVCVCFVCVRVFVRVPWCFCLFASNREFSNSGFF